MPVELKEPSAIARKHIAASPAYNRKLVAREAGHTTGVQEHVLIANGASVLSAVCIEALHTVIVTISDPHLRAIMQWRQALRTCEISTTCTLLANFAEGHAAFWVDPPDTMVFFVDHPQAGCLPVDKGDSPGASTVPH